MSGFLWLTCIAKSMPRPRARQEYVLAERSVSSAPGWRSLPYIRRFHQSWLSDLPNARFCACRFWASGSLQGADREDSNNAELASWRELQP